MRIRRQFLAATMIALAAPAMAGPTEDFQKLQDDYWAATLKEIPAVRDAGGRHDL